MLLTLEEFCGEEGIFEGTGEQGCLFEPMFGQVSATVHISAAAELLEHMTLYAYHACKLGLCCHCHEHITSCLESLRVPEATGVIPVT